MSSAPRVIFSTFPTQVFPTYDMSGNFRVEDEPCGETCPDDEEDPRFLAKQKFPRGLKILYDRNRYYMKKKGDYIFYIRRSSKIYSPTLSATFNIASKGMFANRGNTSLKY